MFKLSFLNGTSAFVLQEFTAKYPNLTIQDSSPTFFTFEASDLDIEDFRNLYSPLGIEDSSGKKISLSRRDWRVQYVPAGINPSLAYILCMVADVESQDIVYDPFCGAGIIPITSLKYFNAKRALCSDSSGVAIEKADVNFSKAGINKEKYKLFRSDINDIKLNKQNVDKIISNLPFGIRVGNHQGNILAYVGLEKLAQKLLRKKGKLVLLTQEKKLLREVFQKEFWKVKSITRVNEGGLYPEIFVIARKN